MMRALSLDWTKGLPTVLEHAKGFIAERLAPANPRNDGKQTPFRGHPICYRAARDRDMLPGIASRNGTASKRGGSSRPEAQAHVIVVIRRWLW